MFCLFSVCTEALISPLLFAPAVIYINIGIGLEQKIDILVWTPVVDLNIEGTRTRCYIILVDDYARYGDNTTMWLLLHLVGDGELEGDIFTVHKAQVEHQGVLSITTCWVVGVWECGNTKRIDA